MLLFIVPRDQVDRYHELREAFAACADVAVILDRRVDGGGRYIPERRHVEGEVGGMGFSIIDTEEVGANAAAWRSSSM